ncbi:MAG TPA: NBR1-Ig-like domain-containing protein [Anaerolineales bacterium]|nr:NBR1-Ig-like domain-containing protein [Anaerolineales bacterium]
MKLKLLVSTILLTLLIAACAPADTAGQEPTPDVAAVRTSAASTVVSQFTLTAAAFTPTPSEPTETRPAQATATGTVTTATAPFAQVTDASGTVISLCDSLEFVADVTVPDDTNMSPGQDFLKTWRVKNTGSCPWGNGYELVYADYSDEMSGQFQPLTQVVQPGQEVELSVQFQAPDEIGEYLSAWQMSNPTGITFPEAIYVKIIVQ